MAGAAANGEQVTVDPKGAFEFRTSLVQRDFEGKLSARAADKTVRLAHVHGTAFHEGPSRLEFSADRDPARVRRPELLGEREAAETARRLLGKPMPCVGREQRWASLPEFWPEMSQSGWASASPSASRSAAQSGARRVSVRNARRSTAHMN